MKWIKISAIIFMTLLALPSLWGREAPEPEADSASESAVPEGGRNQETNTPELSLYEKTLIRDIETAGYYELVAWCSTLGLPDQGSSETLRKHLFDFYKVSSQPQKKINDNVSIITVHSAYNTDYFTIEENDQQMIVLRGDVEVEMEEGGPNPRRHIIMADELVFNQEKQVITARGNLKYTLVSGQTEDVFFGDSLNFSITSWSGLIFKGKSLRKEQVEGKDYTFYFNGETIRKSGSGGIFILDDGTIQTQDREDPDFHLKATKLWMMGPQEWGVLNGILYIGHVPIVYIPFYYKPGNELLFNPVIGSKTRQGNFLQTTTYLIGQKEKDDDFSFLSLGSSSDQEYELVREGLYLMKKEKAQDSEPDTEDYLKVMGDWYSRLGAYTGISGSFNNKGILDSLDYTGGIGVSRNIDSNGNIYFEDEQGDYVPQWNSTVLGSSEYPFRWGQDLSFSGLGISGTLRFYSDPYFNEDFMDRTESFDWLNTLLTTDGSEERIPDTVTDMDWLVRYSNVFQPELLKPFVNSVNVSDFRFNMEWNRRDNEAEENSLSPSRTFFYPDTMNLPYAQVTVSGTPLSYSTVKGWGWAKDLEKDESAEENDTLLPPWETGDKEQEEEKETSAELLPGEYWTTLMNNKVPVFYEGTFSYNISSLFNLESTTDNSEWTEPSDVDMQMEESFFQSNNRLTTTLDNRFYDSRINLTNTNTYTNNYRGHTEIFGLDNDELLYEQKLSDYRSISVDWTNLLDGRYYPLKYYDSFSSSNFKYTLDNQLYSKTFESYIDGEDPVYDEYWGSWDEEKINQHKTGFLAMYKPEYFYISSDSTFNLPPLDPMEVYTNSAGYDIFNWKTDISETIIKQDGEWTFNPLILTTKYSPLDKLSATQTLEYDFEMDKLSRSVSRIDCFGFYTSYTQQYTTPYEWDSLNLAWVEKDDDFVPSQFNTGYTLNLDNEKLWYNRMDYSTSLNVDWLINLQQYNNNVLSFNWEFNYNLFQFIDLKFNMTSSNENMYLYMESYRDKLGIQKNYSFWEDLAKSVNIFSPDQEDRYESHFNIQTINLELVHHLRDWDLTFIYSGNPKLEEDQYSWYSEFTLALVWNPIPKIKSLVQRKDDEWTVDNRGEN